MKKTLSFIAILLSLILIFTGKTFAKENIDTMTLDVGKDKIKPGEEVVVNINFGKDLKEYTLNVKYDKEVFDYVSEERDKEVATDEETGVKLTYTQEEAKKSTSVKFKAKSDIITTIPTEFELTAENLKDNSDTEYQLEASLKETVTIKPDYVDYDLKLEYDGDIVKNEEKDIKISYSSSLGKPYAKAFLEAEIETPKGATAKIIATDTKGVVYDIIKSGFGDTQGYEIGGKDVAQILNTKATFSEAGDYKLTLKLIDRGNADEEIAKKTFDIKVLNSEDEVVEEEKEEPKEEPKADKKDKKPAKLPKTGNNIYVPIILALIATTGSYIYIKKRN